MSDSTIDQAEIDRFSALADEWWDPRGKFKPLHKFNPVRLGYIKEMVARHFGRDVDDSQALSGLRLLDIGCGGGLLSEPMARLGAEVVGADAAATNIEVARIHAERSGLEIDYRATTAEALADAGERFDVVLAMEIVEHVSDVDLFVSACAKMVKPGGLLLLATINRTPKAYLLAILGAEYVLGWLPKGTHQYEKLVRPSELEAAVEGSGLAVLETVGVVFDPLRDRWQRSADIDVNYMMLSGRSASD
ncbi:bifunctional 2-polyprenyl-6-hydroxyphenol methylase/3-demethylubiquinol 3-O-methyltransferase UbiG [Amorphus orientalis]|uniref:Ubiquinone biosynthesis O-methyltransferase n=1 Tax=Amorphus orientalis TaxID=649198 RepID=A0AAE3VKP1_9HYPH|nr:bifunctional 2-polyprenyl-6-hydroxyphenol methylase/3-demethylubiquinol 3-O-methyltransferase UbiG [Amorphus orientalis]MDQ0313909.1 2-polyprenyl-6-hydroxyphenyl methylase/3-demethylubiquinone-9 3-methyltransferase [Amorphus orientalis]